MSNVRGNNSISETIQKRLRQTKNQLVLMGMPAELTSEREILRWILGEINKLLSVNAENLTDNQSVHDEIAYRVLNNASIIYQQKIRNPNNNELKQLELEVTQLTKERDELREAFEKEIQSAAKEKSGKMPNASFQFKKIEKDLDIKRQEFFSKLNKISLEELFEYFEIKQDTSAMEAQQMLHEERQYKRNTLYQNHIIDRALVLLESLSLTPPQRLARTAVDEPMAKSPQVPNRQTKDSNAQTRMQNFSPPSKYSPTNNNQPSKNEKHVSFAQSTLFSHAPNPPAQAEQAKPVNFKFFSKDEIASAGVAEVLQRYKDAAAQAKSAQSQSRSRDPALAQQQKERRSQLRINNVFVILRESGSRPNCIAVDVFRTDQHGRVEPITLMIDGAQRSRESMSFVFERQASGEWKDAGARGETNLSLESLNADKEAANSLMRVVQNKLEKGGLLIENTTMTVLTDLSRFNTPSFNVKEDLGDRLTSSPGLTH